MKRQTDENGCLMLGEISASVLKEQFGTPLYVMEEQKIRDSMRRFTTALTKGYHDHGLICYASKAFCCKEMFRIAASEGLGADVVSLGELYTAFRSGMDFSKLCLHGNNKSYKELLLGIKNGAGRIVADNLEELERINDAAKEVKRKARVMLRIKPGIEAHTHDFVKTGQIDSKFGFALETGEALSAVKKTLELSDIELVGVHCHIGSQILACEPFVHAAEVMINFLAEIKKETDVELPELNLGGGFGIPYTDDDIPLNIENCLYKIFDTVRTFSMRNKIDMPFLIFEPGRSIVAESGTTLYTIGSLKTIPEIRTYLAVDGGMCDNIRYALYRSKYEMAVAGKYSEPKTETMTVAGKCCESGDLLGENVPLQRAEAGDILAVFCTGAYNFSMFSGYNRNLRPAVVMVDKGKSRIVVKKETLDDLIKNDI